MTKAKKEFLATYKKPAKVDMIPKRKNQAEINKELDHRKQDVFIPKNTGKDRVRMAENLQDKFRFADDDKMKKIHGITNEEDKAIQKAMEGKLRLEAKKNYFYKPVEKEKQEESGDSEEEFESKSLKKNIWWWSLKLLPFSSGNVKQLC